MDPNEALARVRLIVGEINRARHHPAHSAAFHKRDAEDLADAFSSLDNWLSGHGPKPAAWS